ncbi:MAG: hypothetical protein U0V87_16835 [Acidobacteriota bacterium]
MSRCFALVALCIGLHASAAQAQSNTSVALVGFETSALRAHWTMQWAPRYLDIASSEAFADLLKQEGVERIVTPREVRDELTRLKQPQLAQPSPESAMALGAALGVRWVMYGSVAEFEANSKTTAEGTKRSKVRGQGNQDDGFTPRGDATEATGKPFDTPYLARFSATVHLKLLVFDAKDGKQLHDLDNAATTRAEFTGAAAGDRAVPTRERAIKTADGKEASPLTAAQAATLQREWDAGGGRAIVMPVLQGFIPELRPTIATALVIKEGARQ